MIKYNMDTQRSKIFDFFNTGIIILLMVSIIYPLWYCLIYSLNDGSDSMRGGIYWWPRVFTLENYISIFKSSGLKNAYIISVTRTIITTSLACFFTAMVAYALSKKELKGHKIYNLMGVITIFFNGGLIPNFILIKSLGLFNNYLVYVFPGMFAFFYVIIFQAFFKEIPVSLEESAKIDGANEFMIFLRIILPISKPVLATVALFVGVVQWNDYFTGVIFINKPKLQPIQTYLFKIISENDTSRFTVSPGEGTRRVTSESIKYATMMATTLPIVCVYPFLQKYFVKGMMIGSIKG